MAKPLAGAARRAVAAPLLPPERPKPKGGRPRIPGRAALAGILFVLKGGIPWAMLPRELGCGSGRVPTEWVLLAALAGLAAGGSVAGGPPYALGPARGAFPNEAADVPPTMVVAAYRLADETARLHEYSPVFDAGRFAAHERFLMEDWANGGIGGLAQRRQLTYTTRTQIVGGGDYARAIGPRRCAGVPGGPR